MYVRNSPGSWTSSDTVRVAGLVGNKSGKCTAMSDRCVLGKLSGNDNWLSVIADVTLAVNHSAAHCDFAEAQSPTCKPHGFQTDARKAGYHKFMTDLILWSRLYRTASVDIWQQKHKTAGTRWHLIPFSISSIKSRSESRFKGTVLASRIL